MWEKPNRNTPVISMDCMYMNEKDDDYNYSALVMYDTESQGAWAIYLKRKGNYIEYVSSKISSIIERLGYPKIG